MQSRQIATLFRAVLEAHTAHNKKEEYRRFDGQTPFFIHPLGMACVILNDATLSYSTRLAAAIAAAIHDVFEDTNLGGNDLLALFPEPSDQLVVQEAVTLVRERLTFETSAASQAAFESTPEKAGLVELLVRGADIVDNLVTMSPQKRVAKTNYMKLLLQHLAMCGAADSEVARRLTEMVGRNC